MALCVFLLALLIDIFMGGNSVINKDVAAGSQLYFVNILLNLTMMKAFVPIENIFYSFHGPSWFLSSLVVFYLIAYFLIPKVKGEKKWLHLVCGICALVYAMEFITCIYIAKDNNNLWLCYVNPFFRIFGECFLGIILYIYMPKLTLLIRRQTAIEIIAIFFALTVYISMNFIHSRILAAWIHALPVSILLIAFNKDTGIISNLFSSRPMQMLGNISFELYMTHAFVYEGIPVALGIVSLYAKNWVVGHPAIRFVITFFSAIIVAHIVHLILYKDSREKYSVKLKSA